MDYQPPKTIDPNCMNYFLRAFFGQSGSVPGPYHIEPVLGGAEAASNLFKATGVAKVSGAEKTWSAVVKIVHPSPGLNDEPSGHHYWKREAEIYQSGLLARLPGGFSAPYCYAVTEAADGSPWIWMQQIDDAVSKPWSIEQYGEAGRVLGRFNGAYLTGEPLPNYPWLADHFLEAYIEAARPVVDDRLEKWDTGVIFRYTDPGLKDILQKAWADRAGFYTALRRLPQVFCHQDAFARNLFYTNAPDGSKKLLGVDWAFTGVAPLGSEIGPLVVASVAFGAIPIPEMTRLEEIVLAGYLQGLAEAGWQGDPRLVRFGYLASVSYRYLFGAIIGEAYSSFQDEQSYPFIEQIFGAPIEMLLMGTAAFCQINADAYHKALTLGQELGLLS
jgi:hypothetical protein